MPPKAAESTPEKGEAPAQDPEGNDDNLPLPDGWVSEMHEGHRLYVNHDARNYSWVHPLHVSTQDGDSPEDITAEGNLSGGNEAPVQIHNSRGGQGVVPRPSTRE